MNLIDDLCKTMEEKNISFKWTCNDHETCRSCVYFYYSCPGFNNSTDLERQAIPKHEKRFIDQIWHDWRINSSAKTYLFWNRFRDIGIEYDNLHQVKALSVEEIKELIKDKEVIKK